MHTCPAIPGKLAGATEENSYFQWLTVARVGSIAEKEPFAMQRIFAGHAWLAGSTHSVSRLFRTCV
jgi:hypothetical protein